MSRGARVGRWPLLALALLCTALGSCSSLGEDPPPPSPDAAGSAHNGPGEARSALDFVESVGLNVHMGYNDTAYANVPAVEAKLRELGVRHVRDGLLIERPDQYAALNKLAGGGIRTNLIMGDPQGRFGTGTLEQQVGTLEAELTGAVDSVEGPNEYDVSGDPDWAKTVGDYQEELYAKVKDAPGLSQLPVVGPSFVESESHGKVGGLADSADFGNIHPYPGGEPPEGNLDEAFDLASRSVPSKPVMATETGYHTALNVPKDDPAAQPPASERAAAVYLPRLYLEYFRRGIQRTFAYELVDEKPDPEQTQAEQHFGVLRNDFTEKPAFTALQNLIDVVRAPEGGCPPRSLDYSLDAGAGEAQQLLLHRCDGSFALVLWQTASVWDPDERKDLSPPERRVTLTLPEPLDVDAYRPVQGTRPLRSEVAVDRIELDIPADPLVVELTPSG